MTAKIAFCFVEIALSKSTTTTVYTLKGMVLWNY